MNGAAKAGYKWTEAGVIPGEWESRRLGQVIRLQRGYDLPYRQRNPGVVPIISSSGTCGYHDDAPVKGPGVVTGRYGTIGDVYFVKEDFWPLNTTLFVKDFYGADPLFISYLLQTIDFHSHSGKSGVPGVNRNDLHELVVVHPPVDEQRVIASALSDADALITGLDQQIAKKCDIQQAAMQQLLTGQRRLPGFSGDWVVKRLGEIGTFLKGSGVTRDQANTGDLPCVRYGEIYTTHHNHIRSFTSFISEDVASTAAPIKKGDVLFAGSGETKAEIGKCVAYLGAEAAYAGGDIILLRSSGKDAAFLGYALNTPSVARQKASLGQGDAVVHISARALAKVELKLPVDQAEQTAIATVLSDMDAELAAIEARRDKARQLKQGMMQELLTGRIRLLTA